MWTKWRLPPDLDRGLEWKITNKTWKEKIIQVSFSCSTLTQNKRELYVCFLTSVYGSVDSEEFHKSKSRSGCKAEISVGEFNGDTKTITLRQVCMYKGS